MHFTFVLSWMVYWLNVASARSALRLLKCSSSLADATQSLDLRARARLISLTTSASPVRDWVSPRVETSCRTPARCKQCMRCMSCMNYMHCIADLAIRLNILIQPELPEFFLLY